MFICRLSRLLCRTKQAILLKTDIFTHKKKRQTVLLMAEISAPGTTLGIYSYARYRPSADRPLDVADKAMNTDLSVEQNS